MAGEDVDGLDASVCVDSDGVHETERVLDSADDALVLLLDGGLNDVTESPVQWGMEIRETR